MIWMHTIELEVRDYELDLQGIVNNSVYQNYLEHGRHLLIKDLGLDFHELHRQGWDPVVVRIELDYKISLTSGDRFMVSSRVDPMGKLRFVFTQEIRRLGNEAVSLEGKVIAATLFNGRPSPCPAIAEALQIAAERYGS